MKGRGFVMGVAVRRVMKGRGFVRMKGRGRGLRMGRGWVWREVGAGRRAKAVR